MNLTQIVITCMSGRMPGLKRLVNINDSQFNYVRCIFTGYNVFLIGDFVGGWGGGVRGLYLLGNQYFKWTYLFWFRSGLEVTLSRVLISWLVKSMEKFMKIVSCLFLSFFKIKID